jgi:hypothetical protein
LRRYDDLGLGNGWIYGVTRAKMKIMITVEQMEEKEIITNGSIADSASSIHSTNAIRTLAFSISFMPTAMTEP